MLITLNTWNKTHANIFYALKIRHLIKNQDFIERGIHQITEQIDQINAQQPQPVFKNSQLNLERLTQVNLPSHWVVYQKLLVSMSLHTSFVNQIRTINNRQRLSNIVVRNQNRETLLP